MAKHKENRKIPDLVISNVNDQSSFESSTGLETEDYTCFGLCKKDTRVLSLKVLFSNGGIALIAYSRMMTPITYNGKNEIKLDTPTMQMVIQGKNLPALIDFLGQQRLAWIQSSGSVSQSDSLMMSKGEPEIIAIQIKSKAKEQKEGS